jgi:hypothetical protein
LKRFVVPPTWPSPPRRSWVPPKTWRPDPSWPPAPEDWRFWVDGKGNPVRGPVGLYGGTSRRVVYAGATALVLFLGVNVWALSVIGLFGGDSGKPQAADVVDDRAATPSVSPTGTPSVTPPRVPTTTTTTPVPPPKTTVTPTQEPSRRPTQEPTKTPTERPTEEQTVPPSTVTTTVTPKASKTPKPRRPRTSQSPTQEELLRQYCLQRGWDPEWCDPDNWEDPSDGPRNGG